MKLNLNNAMAAFQVNESVELNCGTFDLVITQLAAHNDKLKAAIAKKNLANKKASVVNDSATITGTYEGDVEFLVENLIVGWGERPLKDDDGKTVKYSPEIMAQVFTNTGTAGKVLFGKISKAVQDEELFAVRETDLKNS